MNEFKTTSLADQVFEKLENDIIQGVYPKGEILTELKLVEQLGVSRTPIRDALRRLEQERLIADTGKGSVVLGITSEDLLDIMNIREKIEGIAAYYAAKVFRNWRIWLICRTSTTKSGTPSDCVRWKMPSTMPFAVWAVAT